MKCPDYMIDQCPGTGDPECADCIYLRAKRQNLSEDDGVWIVLASDIDEKTKESDGENAA